jgi:hypothetical protein
MPAYAVSKEDEILLLVFSVFVLRDQRTFLIRLAKSTCEH